MGPLRILIVDDFELIRRGIRTIIASHTGWLVCGEVGNGIEAVEKTNLLSPNVILMDISMPGMNGIEATRLIRRRFPDVRVIIVSQNDSSALKCYGLAAAADAFVTKSRLSIDLVSTIEAVTTRPHAPKQDK